MTSEWDIVNARIKNIENQTGRGIGVPESASDELDKAHTEFKQAVKDKDATSISKAIEKIEAILKSMGLPDEKIKEHITLIKAALQQYAGS